ncbi:MAG: IS1182 family transposase [Candidatus Eremiobacteraeota bacterium]|nr:IS1182 family transposase [Candidatus Eremiobacteraeota bacterium]
MSGHFVSSDRDTPMLMSPSLQDWLPANHLARLIVETVEQLDLRMIEDSYAGRGERAYRPKMLVALLLYGYATGVFSSRKLERACFDSVAFRFIAANTSPDHDTIADFRKRILPDLPSIFLQVLLVAKELGVLAVGQISLDGTKMKASASKHRALSYAYAGKIKAKLRREIARLMKLAESAESEPDPQVDIPKEISRRETLIAKIDEARAKIEEREALRHAEVKAKHAERLAQRKEQQRQGKKPTGPRPRSPKLRVEATAQVNLTDEESRIMPTADGFIQGYNAQAAVSIGSQLVIYADVVQDTNDKQQLVPAVIGLQALPETLGAWSDIVADAGYYSEANVQACEAAGVTPYLSMSRQKHHGWLDAKLRKPNSEPSTDAGPVERMAFRLQTPDGRELYAKRKNTVEPVFGIVKSAMGFRSFLLRGLAKVGGEWQLVCTAYNLKHLHALVAAARQIQSPA